MVWQGWYVGNQGGKWGWEWPKAYTTKRRNNRQRTTKLHPYSVCLNCYAWYNADQVPEKCSKC